MVKTPLFATYKSRIIHPRNMAFFSKLPVDALELLDLFLQLDPKKRPTALMALRHPFVQQSEGQDMDLSLSQDCHEMWLRENRKLKFEREEHAAKERVMKEAERKFEREEHAAKERAMKEAMERAVYIAETERATAMAAHPSAPDMSFSLSAAQGRPHYPPPPLPPPAAVRPMELGRPIISVASMRHIDPGSTAVVNPFLIPPNNLNPFI